ncbi:helix-turn-helix transcriptional regulator [Paenibacillus oleatilyticus]|uniref:helix-turn-helix transcriptional regulator n=1 Tax=Paenibacillus oleatilyticus TaxID=2594886 RepID=UPI001C1F6A93|nr:AraC family transcriptional regulator [Paenibacillus oleatilyticus]MBU7317943.1 AraC family transcriptional regulator [Paenibacillus oleatilyticus]
MDTAKAQLLNSQLSNLRVQLLFAKLSVCARDWRRQHFTPFYNKLYYICDGEGWIQVGDEQYRPMPGEFMFIPGGTEQSFSVTEGTPYTMYWCHFGSNIRLGRVLQLLGISHLVKALDPALVQHHFRELIRHFNAMGPTSAVHIQAALFSLIALFLDTAPVKPHHGISSDAERKLIDSLRYIDAHLASELTVEQLSGHAHFHPNYFIRMFKRHMGMPPMKYIHERRLEKAQQLLASTDLTVEEVARRSGFNDVSYFSASFKKYAGVAPKDYRNMLQYGRETMGTPTGLFYNNKG